MAYVHHKAWRLRHPDRRNASKLRHYHRNAAKPECVINRGKRWTQPECDDIFDETKTDPELSVLLGRTEKAIQVQRCKLRGNTTTLPARGLHLPVDNSRKENPL